MKWVGIVWKYHVAKLFPYFPYDPQFKHVILRRIYGALHGDTGDMGPNVTSSSSLAQLRN